MLNPISKVQVKTYKRGEAQSLLNNKFESINNKWAEGVVCLKRKHGTRN